MSGIPAWARVGAKVVCIDDGAGRFERDFPGDHVLRNGEVYTLAALSLEFETPAIQVQELPRILEDRFGYTHEVWMRLPRFRPVKTQEDDLEAHFRVYLKDDHRAPEKADA